MKILKGYKTYVGAAIMASTAVLTYIGYPQYNEILLTLGAALGITGLRNAIGKD